MFLRAATHFHHHVGQMIYLAKEHSRQSADDAAASQPVRYAHTNLVARDWRRLGAFYEQALGCVQLDPERDLSGEWLSRGTGVPGARITGAHYRLPGGGTSRPDARDLSVPPAGGRAAAARQPRRVRPHRVRGGRCGTRRGRR